MSFDITAIRSQYNVFVIGRDAALQQLLTESIKAVGYESVAYYPTTDAALALAQQNPPHVVVYELDGSSEEAEEFLTNLRQVSPETLAIVVSTAFHHLTALQLVSQTLAYDMQLRPLVSMLEVIQKVDRAAGALYYQFESEQIRQFYEQKPKGQASAPPKPQAPEAVTLGESSIHTNLLHTLLRKYSTVKELDQTVQIFLESMSQFFDQVPILYFKYVPSHVSLMFSHAVWLAGEKYRGVGVDLKSEDPARLSDLLRASTDLAAIRDMMASVFRVPKFTTFPHLANDEVVGVFIVLGDVKLENNLVEQMRLLFDLAYQKNSILKEKHALDVVDTTTGVSNRKHFMQSLEDEITRSRRILMPVALILIELDEFAKVIEKIGAQQADNVLWTVARIIKKTTRSNDVIARIGKQQFACILPHTGYEGASIKAERLRRMVEGTKIPVMESFQLKPLHISCGVSEYPSFSNDAELLFRTADEALAQVRSAGGNRVCLSTAPGGFEPEFVPRALESSLHVSGLGRKESPK